MQRFLAGLLLCAALMRPLGAVIVAGGDQAQYETGTNAGTGWNYVGTVNGASGVYLGDYGGSYWVLTAGHVGAGTFTLNGTAYGMMSGSAVSLGSGVDLTLFQLTTSPQLATLNLASSTPTAGTSLTMIGYGIGRSASATYWDVNWNETSNQFLGIYKGYKWTEAQAKRWGTNTVAAAGGSALTTQSFYTNFGTGKGQATSGDSGGGVFLADGTLAGIMLAVTSLQGQPSSTSIYSAPTGANSTYMADISAYRSQILDIITPASVPEPATILLLCFGGALGVTAGFRRRN